MKHTAFESPLDGESGIEKDPDHALIVLQDVGVERPNVVVASDAGKRFQHPGSNPAPVQRIRNSECDLSALRRLRVADVEGNPSHAVASLRDQNEFIIVIGAKQSRDFLVTPCRNPEEPKAQAVS